MNRFRLPKELSWSLLAGGFLLAAWLLERQMTHSQFVVGVLYFCSFVLGSLDLILHLVRSLQKRHFHFDIDFLMLVAALGAAALGQVAEGAFLLFLFSLAHALEHAAMDRAKNAIRDLADLAPPMATIIGPDGNQQVPAESVTLGTHVLIRPGERFPVDGLVVSGSSWVNQAPITGESVPVEKTLASEVFAGTINGAGALTVETTQVVGDRTIDRVIRLVTEARKQKAPTQRVIEQFERIFVPIVLVADVGLMFIPAALGIWTWQTGFYRAMGLLVAASPCALALGTPATVLAAITQAARGGILIKGGVALERLGSLKAMAFDKTGTLTMGRPEVTDLVAVDARDDNELLQVTASLERSSTHPLAEAIVRHATAAERSLLETGTVENLAGRGLRSSLNGVELEVGESRLWAPSQVPERIQVAVAGLIKEGRSVVVTRLGDRWLGVMGLRDTVRPGTKDILNVLRSLNLQPLVMVTGDNRIVAEQIGQLVGVDEVHAQLMPEDKLRIVDDLREKYGDVGMVGDGINDAPALAQASVGIAMGGAGTAVALETADVALMSDDLGRLPFAVSLSRSARRIIAQNLAISLAIIAILIVGTVFGLSSIGLTVVAHEGSTLVVLANALRLLAYQGDTRPDPAPGG